MLDFDATDDPLHGPRRASHTRPAAETRTQKPTFEMPKTSRRFAVWFWVSVIRGRSSTLEKPSSTETVPRCTRIARNPR